MTPSPDSYTRSHGQVQVKDHCLGVNSEAEIRISYIERRCCPPGTLNGHAFRAMVKPGSKPQLLA